MCVWVSYLWGQRVVPYFCQHNYLRSGLRSTLMCLFIFELKDSAILNSQDLIFAFAVI